MRQGSTWRALAPGAPEVRWCPPDGDVSIAHQIDVPSGSVSIGDAKAEEFIPVVGSCIVTVALDDDNQAEHVTIWHTPSG